MTAIPIFIRARAGRPAAGTAGAPAGSGTRGTGADRRRGSAPRTPSGGPGANARSSASKHPAPKRTLVEPEDYRAQSERRQSDTQGQPGPGARTLGCLRRDGGLVVEVRHADPAEVIIDRDDDARDRDRDQSEMPGLEGGDEDEELRHESREGRDARERAQPARKDSGEERALPGEPSPHARTPARNGLSLASPA